jgi:hypothetical protein
MPALSGLSKAWVVAEAAVPNGWRLMGVVLGPREVDPRIASAEWCAWARPVVDAADYKAVPSAEGRGESAEGGLTALARNLREMTAD